MTAAPLERAPAGLLGLLAAHGARVALRDEHGAAMSYAELALRADAQRARLGPTRRLVAVEAANTVEAVVDYAAALAGHHPVLLVPGAGPARSALLQAWDPDVVLSGGTLREHRPGTAHDLHPDLALLLSTSGSAGAPKLVRLSRANLLANARAVAASLGVRPDDRAVTALPLQYCYGLSVLHSHLLVGAGVVLTERSVSEEAFWDLVARERVTTLPGVPHTFDLLERTGFAARDLPHLRALTQAGGRLAPERVRAVAELGRRKGFDLHVMYGATEATARMAVLPADLAFTRPQAIGRPVPGGAFSLRDVGPDGVGEIVYRGPNVMMGYARTATDLALGAGPQVLPTGDLGRRAPDGLWEVVGRRSRLAKVFGLRVDLDHAEARLAESGWDAWCLDGGDRVLVAVHGAPDALSRVRLAAAGACGLPPTAVQVRAVDTLPRTPSGKPDREPLRPLFQEQPAPVAGVAEVYATVLDRPQVRPEDTFVSLGGDSLSFVEASVRLEALLGTLPPDWHLSSVAELSRRTAPQVAPGRRRRLPRVDVTVAVRALAILLVVGSHADLFEVLGGAHLLLAVAGFNLARFQGGPGPRRERARAVLRLTGRIAAPTVAFIGAATALGAYPWFSPLLLNWLVGPARLGRAWELWFLEALVLALLAAAALLSVPLVDRWERRAPFGSALAVLAVSLAVRELVRLQPGAIRVYGVLAVGWLVVLGWACARASTVGQRVGMSLLALLVVPGFFANPAREAVVVVGVLLLLWVRAVPLPALVARATAVLASASLFVYLTHWQVFPHLETRSPLLAVLASLAVGLAYQRFWTTTTGRMRRTG